MDNEIFKESLSVNETILGDGYSTCTTRRANPYKSIEVEDMYQAFKSRLLQEIEEEEKAKEDK